MSKENEEPSKNEQKKEVQNDAAARVPSTRLSSSQSSSSFTLSALTQNFGAIPLPTNTPVSQAGESKKEIKETKTEIIEEELDPLLPDQTAFISPFVAEVHKARASSGLPVEHFFSPIHIQSLKTQESKLDSKRKPKRSPEIAPSISTLPNFLPRVVSPERRAAMDVFEIQKTAWAERVAEAKRKGTTARLPQCSQSLKDAFKRLQKIEDAESLAQLKAVAENPERLLEATRKDTIEHTARQISTFFYKLIAYYNTQILPVQGKTILQHGKGYKHYTEACHSSLFPHLIDESILLSHPLINFSNGTNPIVRRGILSATHFSNCSNATVELPLLTNDTDGKLEGKIESPSDFRRDSMEILRHVAQGFMNPVEGLTEFIILRQETLIAMQDSSESQHEIDILDAMLEGTMVDKLTLTPTDASLDYAFTHMLLRLLPGEIMQCEQDPAVQNKIYRRKLQEIQREILNSVGAFVTSTEYRDFYIERGKQLQSEGNLEESLENYRYAQCYATTLDYDPKKAIIQKSIADLEVRLISDHVNKGNTYCQQNNFMRAAQEFEYALSLCPTDASHIQDKLDFYKALSGCFFALKNYDVALDYCNRALKIAIVDPALLLRREIIEKARLAQYKTTSPLTASSSPSHFARSNLAEPTSQPPATPQLTPTENTSTSPTIL